MCEKVLSNGRLDEFTTLKLFLKTMVWKKKKTCCYHKKGEIGNGLFFEILKPNVTNKFLPIKSFNSNN